MTAKKYLTAFTLIEMAVVMMIIGITAAIAFGSILTAWPRMRVRGDVWNVNQALQKARMLAVSENANYGVVFFRKGSAPDYTYYYYIFKDINPAGGDGLFTDTNGDPLHQCEVLNPPDCPTADEDPIIGILQTLDRNNFFDTILGTTLTNTPIAIVFQPPIGGTALGGDVVIQSNILYDKTLNVSYAGAITINQATGNTTRTPPALRPHP